MRKTLKYLAILQVILYSFLCNYLLCFSSKTYQSTSRDIQFNSLWRQQCAILGYFFSPSQISHSASKTSQLVSQEIIIKGIDNKYLKEKLISLIDIDLSKKSIIDTDQLDIWITQMRLSGFFSHVEKQTVSNDGHQYVYINVIVNPLLQSIYIVNYSKKLVPEAYILFLFRNYLGKPINFSGMDIALSMIRQWYQFRGYAWAEVFITYDAISESSIYIHIAEGLVNKVDVIGFTQDNLNIGIENTISSMNILDFLKIKPGSAANVHCLDQGIAELKRQKLILNCYYEITQNNSKKTEACTLNLLLYLEIINSRSTYVFSKYVAVESNLLDIMDAVRHHSSENVAKQQEYFRTVRQNNFYSYIVPTICDFFCGSLYLSPSTSDNLLYLLTLVDRQKHQHGIKIHEQPFSSLYLATRDNFGFKHYIRHLGTCNSNFLVSASFPAAGPCLSINYEIPQLHLLGETYSQFHLGYIKNFYQSVLVKSSSKPGQTDTNARHSESSAAYQECFFVNLRHRLIRFLMILEQVALKSFSYESSILNNNIQWLYLQMKNHLFDNKKIITGVESNCTYCMQNSLVFDFHLSHENADNKDASQSLYCQSTVFLPRLLDLYKLVNFAVNYSNKFIIIFKKNFVINKYMAKLYIKFISLIGNKCFLPYSEDLLTIDSSMIRGYKEEIISFPSKLIKFSFEYHYLIKEKSSFFIFIDCMHYKSFLTSKKDNLNHRLYNSPNDILARISYGIGLQIITPLRQIPPLVIEYGYNIHNGQCFHLRIKK